MITSKGDNVMNKNGIKDIDVDVRFINPSYDFNKLDPGQGIIKMTAVMDISFIGDIQQMAAEMEPVEERMLAVKQFIVDNLRDVLKKIGG
jgi:hypothetical protein